MALGAVSTGRRRDLGRWKAPRRTVNGMSSLTAAMRLLLLLAAELAAVVVLLWVGDVAALAVPLDGVDVWLATTATDLVVVALLRMVGLAGALWLLASTLLYALALAIRAPAAVRAVGWATLPAVRRVAERGVALAVVTSTVVGGPAAALAAPGSLHQTPPPPAVAGPESVATDVAEGRPPPDPSPGPSPDHHPADDHSTATPAPPEPADPDAEPAAGARGGDADGDPSRVATSPPPARSAAHVVQAGESLWSIAADQVGTTDPRVVGPYWAQLLAANPDLPSGDPDLVHPGDQVRVPPLPAHLTS
ncbi:hypothetical protein BH23ACT8_BH23ACT8_03740 [soil metagenome]